MAVTPSQSTRDLAALLVQYGTARKTTKREALFAHGAELATIASLMLANVSQAVDIATAEIRGQRMPVAYEVVECDCRVYPLHMCEGHRAMQTA
ncbi:hypothetical protein [Microbacterium sp. NPDC089696]|uniref:hypothetical protein n=1 Tax=Microbacterium sp. NPDC089696 TaxID=3364199 RepID=UPI00381A0E6C